MLHVSPKKIATGNNLLHSRRFKLLTMHSTVIAAVFSGGYARPSYAGSCVRTSPGTYLCSGAADPATDLGQSGYSHTGNLTVTTSAGFGLDAAADTNRDAFYLRAYSGAQDLIFTDNYQSEITGAQKGIYAFNEGTGKVDITLTGDVTGLGGDGIYLETGSETTSVNISVANVEGDNNGLDIEHFGTEGLQITSSGLVQGNANGIEADINNSASTGDLTIEVTNVKGSGFGIIARNDGTADLRISAGHVEANVQGIVAVNDGTDLLIDAHTVQARNGNAIRAVNEGSGALSITSSGTITSANSTAINATNFGADLSIEVADVSGGNSGVQATNYNSGALSIISTGDVSGTDVYGIYARTFGTDLTISAANVSGYRGGIIGRNLGNGAMLITSTGDVTTAKYNGIFAYNSGTDLTISAATVSGGERGIFAHNTGSGKVSITATGKVSSTTDDGIDAYNSSAGTDLSIEVVDVSGGNSGVQATNNGSGVLSITSTGHVSGANGKGINAANYGTDLTINTGSVFGENGGIDAQNHGSGDLTITSTGPVEVGFIGSGIRARNYGANLVIDAQGGATGGIGSGIDAINYGSGGLEITAGGTSIASFAGISAENSASGTNLIIDADEAIGGFYAIRATNNGTGELRITVNEASNNSPDNGAGINAINSANGTGLTIEAGTVIANFDGIYASNNGSGALSISSDNLVSGGVDQEGIHARNSSNGTDLLVTAHDVVGGVAAIDARNDGSGKLSITTTGHVSAGGYNAAIVAESGAASTGDIRISTASVSGFDGGIEVRNNGTGDVYVETSGYIYSENEGDGISVVNAATDGNVSVTARDDVYGGYGGIRVDNDAAGSVSIIATNVRAGDYGILVDNANSAGGDITIDVSGTVNSGQEGIYVLQGGAGRVNITVDSVTSENSDGIYVENSGGDLSITATGAVTGNGSSSQGIAAINTGSGNLTTQAVEVAGTNSGIDAQQLGSGGLEINAYESVIGHAFAGINAYSGSTAIGDQVIEAADVSGGIVGIYAQNEGAGSQSITVSGNVAGTFNGINAINSGTDLTVVTTGTVTGDASEAIDARNYGSGSLYVSVRGTVESNSAPAIVALNGETAGDTNILVAATVTGETGLAVEHDGSGPLAINISGDVTGNLSGPRAGNGNGAGLVLIRVADGATTGTIANSGSITSLHEEAVYFEGRDLFNGDFDTTFTNTGTITGGNGIAINAEATTGDAIFNQAGGLITGDILLGSGNDTLNITGGAVEGDVIATAGANTLTNAGVLTGRVDLGEGANVFRNLAGGYFAAGATVNIGSGNTFSNAATFSPGGSDSILTTAVTGNLVQTATGVFAVDVDLVTGMSDLVNISGTADMAGSVDVGLQNITVEDLSAGAQEFTLVSAAGGLTDSGLALLQGQSPALQAELLYPNATDLELGLEANFTDIAGLNANQSRTSANLNNAFVLGGGGLDPVLNGLLATTGLDGYKNALDQLGPEIYGAVETGVLVASRDFAANLLSCKQAKGQFAAIAEGQCMWLRPYFRHLNRNTTAETVGFREYVGGLAGGVQFTVAPNWFVGGGFGYEAGNINASNGASSDFGRYQGGVSVKYVEGPLLLAASLGGGISNDDITREIAFGTFSGTATSNPDTWFVTGQLRAAYLKEFDSFYAKPALDLTWTGLDREGVTESGAGAANLNVAGATSSYGAVSPSVEIGKDFAMSEGRLLRAFARVGATYFTDDAHTITADFVNAPAGTGSFTNTTDLDQLFGDVELGATLFGTDRFNLSASYQGRFSANTAINGGNLRMQLKF
ncbi:autotransporter domain-containing protein [Roseibium sp. SCP14]|uniref:autotransporter domain-containing protein n=1 Tax=Roseibium sp. SCP14 TaxID=3141375 RepID=UPI0033390ABC